MSQSACQCIDIGKLLPVTGCYCHLGTPTIHYSNACDFFFFVLHVFFFIIVFFIFFFFIIIIIFFFLPPGRTPPVAALRASDPDHTGPSERRSLVGTVVTAAAEGVVCTQGARAVTHTRVHAQRMHAQACLHRRNTHQPANPPTRRPRHLG